MAYRLRENKVTSTGLAFSTSFYYSYSGGSSARSSSRVIRSMISTWCEKKPWTATRVQKGSTSWKWKSRRRPQFQIYRMSIWYIWRSYSAMVLMLLSERRERPVLLFGIPPFSSFDFDSSSLLIFSCYKIACFLWALGRRHQSMSLLLLFLASYEALSVLCLSWLLVMSE